MVHQPADSWRSIFFSRKKTGICFFKRYDGLCSQINRKKIHCSKLARRSYAIECKFGKEVEGDFRRGYWMLDARYWQQRIIGASASLRITTRAISFTKGK